MKAFFATIAAVLRWLCSGFTICRGPDPLVTQISLQMSTTLGGCVQDCTLETRRILAKNAAVFAHEFAAELRREAEYRRPPMTLWPPSWVAGLLVMASVLAAGFAHAQDAPRLRETDWSKRIAEKLNAEAGKADFAVCEYRLPDASRVDIQTPDESIEVEWAHGGKWKEAIGQSLFYAINTGRRPAIILLVDPALGREETSIEYLRCKLTAERVGIRVQVWPTQ